LSLSFAQLQSLIGRKTSVAGKNQLFTDGLSQRGAETIGSEVKFAIYR
jgi:hypothetical protein